VAISTANGIGHLLYNLQFQKNLSIRHNDSSNRIFLCLLKVGQGQPLLLLLIKKKSPYEEKKIGLEIDFQCPSVLHCRLGLECWFLFNVQFPGVKRRSLISSAG